MSQTSAKRRLAAILAADVVGYSRLIGLDEEGARAAFNDHLDTRIAPAIAAHHGRIVKTMGDGLLVEFASAVDAVRCAFDFQSAMEAQSDPATESRMQFRIGVNLGDVIVEGDDIHGDGVNVAAQLEGLAEPGGVVVSGIVHQITRGKVPFAFDDIGPQTVKNIADPVPAFRIRGANEPERAAPPPASSAPDTPSIAVLPFSNMGGDPEQAYFAEGVAEDLITDLSQIPGLHVVARNASFAPIGDGEDVAAAGRRLGVRNILTGGVRRAGDRLRINVRLVEAETGGQLWAERYDGAMSDIFDLQDDINTQVVDALKLRLGPGRGARKPARNPEAYEYCLKGRAEYYLYMPRHMMRALEYFEKAIALDPDYAEAYAYLSYCKTAAHVAAWPGADDTLDPAIALARKAIALDPNSPVAHARLGWVLGYLDRADEAVETFDRALALDPENAEALFAYGETMNRLARPERALPLLEKAFGVSTLTPPSWGLARGHSYNIMGRWTDAIAQLAPVVARIPDFAPARVQLVCALHGLGDLDGAAEEAAAILRVAPKFSEASAARMFPYPDPSLRTRMRDALVQAGLPA